MNTDRYGFFSKKGPKTREEVRSSLRVVPGGKAATPVWLDNRELNEDRFLREHYLDKNYLFGIVAESDAPYHDDDDD